MSYLPSEDPKQFRAETLGLTMLCLAFTIALGVLVYFTDNIVVSLR